MEHVQPPVGHGNLLPFPVLPRLILNLRSAMKEMIRGLHCSAIENSQIVTPTLDWLRRSKSDSAAQVGQQQHSTSDQMDVISHQNDRRRDSSCRILSGLGKN
jgi:predicted nucleic acid-binding protein